MFRQAWRHSSVFWRATQAYRAVSSSRSLQKATGLETKPPQPGTVAPYEHHVFIRFPPKQAPDAAQGGWWPKIVERMPEFLQAFGAVAANRKHIEGVVRISAYEEADLSVQHPARAGKCDMMLFPSGMWLRGLDQEAVPRVIAAAVTGPTEGDPDFQPPALNKSMLNAARSTPTISLFVCTHGSRDCRCGAIGGKMVKRLDSIITERGLQDKVRAFRCSHVGGHKYAGNVLVYGPASPCDGDWYGGVTADSAEAFLDALFGADVAGHGGVSEPALRPLWRGRMGLTKEEQMQAFESAALPEDDLDAEDDWECIEEEAAVGEDIYEGSKSNEEALKAGMPLAEVSRQVFQEHKHQGNFTDADTAASGRSSRDGATSSIEIEFSSSSGGDFTSSTGSELGFSDSSSDTEDQDHSACS